MRTSARGSDFATSAVTSARVSSRWRSSLSGPLFPGPGQSGVVAGDPTATNQLAISTVLGMVVRSD